MLALEVMDFSWQDVAPGSQATHGSPESRS